MKLGVNLASLQGIYCINLERRTDRWERMCQRFAEDEISVERFSAVTPEDPRIPALTKSLGSPLIAACALSHRDTWRLALDRGQERVLILEDDVFFHRDWKKILDASIKQLDEGSISGGTASEIIPATGDTAGGIDPTAGSWDLLLLNASGFHTWEEGLRAVGSPLFLTGAYVINAHAMRSLLNECETLAADYMLIWLQEQKKRSYFYFPYLALQEFLESDIGGSNQEHVQKLRQWCREQYQPHFGHHYRETFA